MHPSTSNPRCNGGLDLGFSQGTASCLDLPAAQGFRCSVQDRQQPDDSVAVAVSSAIDGLIRYAASRRVVVNTSLGHIHVAPKRRDEAWRTGFVCAANE